MASLEVIPGTDREERIVTNDLLLFSQLQIQRANWATQCEEIASLLWPEYRNTFFYGGYNMPGRKLTDFQVDATGMLAKDKFGAICDSLITPRNQEWHGLAADDPYVMKDRDTQLWFEDATRQLFADRYATYANFTGQNQQNYAGLGVFGNMAMFVDEFDFRLGVGGPGIRYMALPPGELFLIQNHQGLVDGFVRWYRRTARQAYQKWGNKIPEALVQPLEKHSELLYDFLHVVVPNDEYDPDALLHPVKGKPWVSHHISITGRKLMGEGGYFTFPVAVGRYSQGPGEVNGRSIAMSLLPALKSLNDMKRTQMKIGHRNADPILLTPEDGLIDPRLIPGTFMKGGMDGVGHRLVDILPAGNYEVAKEQREEEANLINDGYLVRLFQILVDTPQMTATEVIERTNEKGILLAPTIGRLQSEYLGPLIDRELDILSRLGRLRPMPPRLKEAKGSYKVIHKSPLSKMMRAQEAAGFMRTLEAAHQIAANTGLPDAYDPFNFDVAIPEMADINGVKPSWMATQKEIAAKKKGRAQSAQQQQQTQMLPAQASMVSAQAKMLTAKQKMQPPA